VPIIGNSFHFALLPVTAVFEIWPPRRNIGVQMTE
jgi:hypothetical protein